MPHDSPTPSADAIADTVLRAFDALPRKCKPRTLPDGRREWVPLAGIVLSRGETRCPAHLTSVVTPIPGRTDGARASLTCAALATGMKCLPAAKVPLARGNVLHDSHAETLALRAFNHFLIDECADLARRGRGSTGPWLRWRRDGSSQDPMDPARHTPQQQPFALHPDVQLHLYTSSAPCGDASMELTMAAAACATPWPNPPAAAAALPGRAHFGRLGIVRRKPARADAPPSLSKSCSDKLAAAQCTGVLCALAAALVHPRAAYLLSVVLPESQHVPAATARAFGKEGRLAALAGREWGGAAAGYRFAPFALRTTAREFAFAKPRAAAAAVPSNLATVATPRGVEVLINGVRQGRAQADPRGASAVCRRSLWRAAREVAVLGNLQAVLRVLGKESYAEVKLDGMLAGRRAVRAEVTAVLGGWERNVGDEGWGLDGG